MQNNRKAAQRHYKDTNNYKHKMIPQTQNDSKGEMTVCTNKETTKRFQITTKTHKTMIKRCDKEDTTEKTTQKNKKGKKNTKIKPVFVSGTPGVQ